MVIKENILMGVKRICKNIICTRRETCGLPNKPIESESQVHLLIVSQNFYMFLLASLSSRKVTEPASSNPQTIYLSTTQDRHILLLFTCLDFKYSKILEKRRKQSNKTRGEQKKKSNKTPKGSLEQLEISSKPCLILSLI